MAFDFMKTIVSGITETFRSSISKLEREKANADDVYTKDQLYTKAQLDNKLIKVYDIAPRGGYHRMSPKDYQTMLDDFDSGFAIILLGGGRIVSRLNDTFYFMHHNWFGRGYTAYLDDSDGNYVLHGSIISDQAIAELKYVMLEDSIEKSLAAAWEPHIDQKGVALLSSSEGSSKTWKITVADDGTLSTDDGENTVTFATMSYVETLIGGIENGTY